MGRIEPTTGELRLKDLTVDDYKFLKKAKAPDAGIIKTYNTNQAYFTEWKKKNGLLGYRIKPEHDRKVEARKKKYIDLYNKGWNDDSIADELGMGRTQLAEFKKKHLPEYKKRKSYVHFTREQCQIVKEKGLLLMSVKRRVDNGDTFEEAISKPFNERKLKFTDEQLKQIKKSGFKIDTIRYRILKSGLTFEQAIEKPLNAISKKWKEKQK